MDNEKQSGTPAWMPAARSRDWLAVSRIVVATLALTLTLQYLASPRSIESQLRAHRHGPLPPELASSLSLTESQCRIAFPKLESTLKGPSAYWKKRGGIRESWVVDHGSREQGRAVIWQNRVYVKRYGKGIDTRTLATFSAIRDAVITSLEPLPDIDFAFRTDDHQENFAPQWQMVRHETDPDSQSVWLMPDFGIHAWPEPAINGFAEFLEETDRVESEQSWAEKDPRLFWRGAMLSKGREELINITANASWADVEAISWTDPDKAAPRVDMWDSCRYKFLAHTKGVAELYSGRLKYLLACDSVVVQKSVEWDQHFHPAIDARDGSPTQNTVIVPNESWEDLPQVMDALLKDDKRARRIARNARNAFRHRYLSPAATNCYWRALIRHYGAVQAFEPNLFGAVDIQSFMLMRKTEWIPH